MTTESRADFARRLGWNRSSVTRAVQDGRVVLIGSMVDVDASMAKIEAMASPSAHHRAHALQLEEARETKQASIEVPAEVKDSIEGLNLRLKRAEADKREEEAKTAKLQRQILEGEYAHVDTVLFALKDHSAQIMGLHENVADRLTPLIDPLQSYEEKRAAISEFMTDLQHEIHESSERSKRLLGKNG